MSGKGTFLQICSCVTINDGFSLKKEFNYTHIVHTVVCPQGIGWAEVVPNSRAEGIIWQSPNAANL